METESKTANTSRGDLHVNQADFEQLSVRESQWDDRAKRQYGISIHGVTSITRKTRRVPRNDGATFPVTNITILHRDGSETVISAFLREDKS